MLFNFTLMVFRWKQLIDWKQFKIVVHKMRQIPKISPKFEAKFPGNDKKMIQWKFWKAHKHLIYHLGKHRERTLLVKLYSWKKKIISSQNHYCFLLINFFIGTAQYVFFCYGITFSSLVDRNGEKFYGCKISYKVSFQRHIAKKKTAQ